MLTDDVGGGAAMDALARMIGDAIARPYEINGAVAHVTASIGIARVAPDLAGADVIMMQADRALYRAKEDGGNCSRFHSHELDRQIRERAMLGDELRGAAGRGELELHYQPQVELASGGVLGLAASLRWRHPTRGLVPPGLFMALAERNGASSHQPMGVRRGLPAISRLGRRRHRTGVLAVNFSALHLAAAVDLDRSIEASLQRWRVPSSRMELELAESALMAASEIGGTLDKLRRVGLRITLDEFGRPSSLSYLVSRPVSRLKIAGQIVAGSPPIRARPGRAHRYRACTRARHRGLAAGVATPVQARSLAALECNQA